MSMGENKGRFSESGQFEGFAMARGHFVKLK